MLKEGTLIYFTPFYFENQTTKDKFFIVLKNIKGETILASLPTSRDNIPSEHEDRLGCIELPSACINCFVIPQSMTITECGFAFKKRTHIYGAYIKEFNIRNLQEDYPLEGMNYKIIGKIKDNIFADILSCLKNSRAIKQRYKRVL